MDEILSICTSPLISSLDHLLVRAFEHQSEIVRDSVKKKMGWCIVFSRAIIYFVLSGISTWGFFTSLLARPLTFQRTG